MLSVGTKIANLRKKKKLTQEELAKRIKISRAALSHYEKDRRQPDYETVTKMAEYFNVTTDYLLGHSDDPSGTNIEEREKEKDALMEILKDAPKDERERIKEEALAYAKYLTDARRKD